METIGITELIENNDEDTEVVVLVGLSDETPAEKIDAYCGSGGEVLKDPGFGMCRVRLTVACLRELKLGAEVWVDFIEPAAQDAEVSWDTEYEKEYNSS